MFWREDEKDSLWNDNQIRFAEIAHSFLCCDVPTIKKCFDCKIEYSEDCPNKKEVNKWLK